MTLPMLSGMLRKPSNRQKLETVSLPSYGYIAVFHAFAVAVQALQQTVVHLTKGGRFRQAADREKEIAQIYLQDGLLGKACESYVRAGDWYSQEDANA